MVCPDMRANLVRLAAAVAAALVAAIPWPRPPQTPHLKRQHLRKSSQFWALTRQHAELVASDEEVYAS